MYKLYVRPHLEYGDIIHHKVDPELSLDSTKKLEATQYSAALVVSCAWRGTSKCKLYKELGWENLYHRRWYRRLTHFFKLKQSRSPLYLYNLIPPEREVNYNLRRIHAFDQQVERTNRYGKTYLQNCPKEWNQLDVALQSSQTISEFKRRLIYLVRPPKRSVFNIHDLDGVKLLARLQIKFSDLCSQRFNHNFHCPHPFCLCKTGIEDNEHFLLHCPCFSSQHKGLLDLVSSLTGIEIMRLSSKELCRLLLYGCNDLSVIVNRGIIEETKKFIRSTGRFEKH